MPKGIYIRTSYNGAFKKGHTINIGRKHTELTKEKLRIKHKGKVLTEAHKQALRVPRKGSGIYIHKSGRESSSWKSGISKVDHLCRRMPEYKQWRSDCFVRDNWTCQTCRITGVYLTVHHKKGFSKILKENNINNILDARKCSELWDIINGITLCEECHKLTDNYKGLGKTHLTKV